VGKNHLRQKSALRGTPATTGGQETRARGSVNAGDQQSPQANPSRLDMQIQARRRQSNSVIGVENSFTTPSDKTLADGKVQDMHNADNITRRFANESELKRFAADHKAVDTMGHRKSDNEWFRLPAPMLVLGETHGDGIVPGIINAVGTKKWQYEGFKHHSAARKRNDAGLKKSVKAADEAMGQKLGGTGNDGIHADNISAKHEDHSAEHALPKYARSTADVYAMAAQQRAQKGPWWMAAGTEMTGMKAPLVRSLGPALKYAKSYSTKWSSHPLKTFYKKNKAKVDALIVVMETVQESMPDFATYEDLLKQLSTAYTKAARAKLGVSKDSKLEKATGALDMEPRPKKVTDRLYAGFLDADNHDQAQENDKLRDLSMLKTAKKAKKGGTRLFVIGDSHRKRQARSLKSAGIEVQNNSVFVDQEKDRNAAAQQAVEGFKGAAQTPAGAGDDGRD
jgi:hypothetical protein